jgi:plasmid maintenance system killer protein
MDYTPKPYYKVSMSRKRQIIDAQLDELHNMQLDMIDAAVEQSDLQDAQELINYIRSL